jgi:phthiocerol/phenolphthiocerol synthesis type-I polyketide synthase C
MAPPPSRDDLPADAIAIVGMAFRFPGDLRDEDALWRALRDGRDLVTQIPAGRWATDELQHPRRGEPGRSITFAAGVVSGLDDFDAAFFGISPREAAALDPQQRMMLELAWEAIEDAGLRASALAGSDAAVYVGVSSLDNGMRGLDDLSNMTPHAMTGNTLSLVANRLSYFFDLRGASMAIDTACSSSLVAVHHACEALRRNEAPVAFAGGVNLLLHPYSFVGFTKASMLSAQGRCRAFDADGDGYVRAEGAAVLVLKRARDAVAAGDPIHALILASGINTDGARKTGLTIPSREAQSQLMAKVLARSGLAAAEVDFIEAHGTGTPVGDPIEAHAIAAVYGQGRDSPLPIGSVKTNLGHLEPVSGLAGLVKSVLALKHRELPASLHFATPNPYIDFDALNLQVATRSLKFDTQRHLVAGVNSFGFGGANAHVLLQEAGDAREAASAPVMPPPLFLSARSDEALRALAAGCAEALALAGDAAYYAFAHTAAHRRDRMEKRFAVHGASVGEIVASLDRVSRGESDVNAIFENGESAKGDLAFVYAGNGAQWAGMGRALFAESARFRALIAEIDHEIRAFAEISIATTLHADDIETRLADTAIAQPLLFAMQYAITAMLRDRGIVPAAVTGHSVGEIAAASAAGALDLPQALRVVCARSQAQAGTRGRGRMAALGMSADAAAALIARLLLQADVEIACRNSPTQVTLSGSLAALTSIEAQIEPDTFFRLLDLDYAFHSRHMDGIAAPLRASLADLSPRACTTTMISTVTGQAVDGTALDADYWWRNVREPVRFSDAIAALSTAGCRTFVEIGPNAILQRYLAECLAAGGIAARVLPTLRRGDDVPARLDEAALRVHLCTDGTRLDAYFPLAAPAVRLPSYPWQRERHAQSPTSESHRLTDRRRVHPLLGWRLTEVAAGWENSIDAAVLPWLDDHRVGGHAVLPGTAYAELALAAARELSGGERLACEDLDIVAPMGFDAGQARLLRFTVDTQDGRWRAESRRRLSDEAWTLHATGRLVELCATTTTARIELADAAGMQLDHDTQYRLSARVGVEAGPAFRGVASSVAHGDFITAQLALPDSVTETAGYLLHPAALDACFQAIVACFREEIEAGDAEAMLPVRMARVERFAGASIVQCSVRLRRRSARSLLADFEAFDANGELVARVSGCRFSAAALGVRVVAEVGKWHVVPRLRPHPAQSWRAAIGTDVDIRRCVFDAFAECEQPLARRAWYRETLPLFEALSLSLLYESFGTEASQRPGRIAQLATDASLAPPLRWALARLQNEGLLRIGDDGQLQLLADADIAPATPLLRGLLRDVPAGATLLARLACNARCIVAGTANVPRLHDDVFADDPAHLGVSLALQATLRALAATLPASRRLRVLEISSADGELARLLSRTLATDRLEFVRGVFDDEARERWRSEFAAFPNFDIARIDASSWMLTAEHALPGTYDVVVLNHALHRADVPAIALSQVQRWLAPGGLLLLAERYPDWYAELLHGADAAWWQLDAAVNPLSPLLHPQAWRASLLAAGFDDVEALTEPAADHLAEGSFLLHARAPVRVAREERDPVAASWALLIDAASSALADSLRCRLEARGQRVLLIEREEVLPAADHVVHLRGWDDAADDIETTPSSLLRCMQTCASRTTTPRFWIVTRGGAVCSGLHSNAAAIPVQAALWGLGRVAMNEFPALSCQLIDLAGDLCALDLPARLTDEWLDPDGTDEMMLSDDARHALVLEPFESSVPRESIEPRFELGFDTPGQLRNLRWRNASPRPLRPGEIEVRTYAAGLNFRDVMYALGLLPEEAVEGGFAGATLGLEFAGEVVRVGEGTHIAVGDKVMGFGPACFASHIVTRADAVAPLPSGWSFAAAATVPSAFVTAWYALKHLAALQPGERVLIHGAAGAVGLAALQIARALGAEIFATAGSDDKRELLRRLGADHVFDSRTLAFSDDVFAATNGEGVDVVLNSLAGEALRRSLQVLRPFGRFLELGKRDFYANSAIGMRPLKDNIAFFGIDADRLLVDRPALAARLFDEVMAQLRDGRFHPLPHRVLPADRIVDAFRTMQQSRHVGKLVVSLTAPPENIDAPSSARHAMQFDSDEAWLVTGGLGGFGLESARWLAARGVRHLLLLGRRGMATPGAEQAVAELRATGVNVLAEACDVSDAQALRDVLRRARETLPPLTGVLHAAMVIDDGLLADIDAARLAHVLAPKLRGALNLHAATLADPLRHFVLYSSVTTLLGSPGQGNYVAANAGLEGLARLRRQHGLPATCIAWGPIADAGFLARNEALRDGAARRLGGAALSCAEALQYLERALVGGDENHCVARLDWNVLSRLLPSAQGTRFTALAATLAHAGHRTDAADFRSRIEGTPDDEVLRIAIELVREQVARILCIGAERIEMQRPLHDLGMDSLMAVELAHDLEQVFGVAFPIMALNESPSVERVARRLLDAVRGSETTQPDLGQVVQHLARQHGETVSDEQIALVAQEAAQRASDAARTPA